MPAGSQDRPLIIVAEQTISDLAHMHHVLMLCANATQNAENCLHEERRLYQPAVDEMGEIIEVAYIVALELEARTVVLS